MAVMAARKAERDVVVVPCGLRYYYVEDPLQDLVALMDRVEDALFWRSRSDLPMPERLYRVASGMLGLKELEYLDGARDGPVPERITYLTDAIPEAGRGEIRSQWRGERRFPNGSSRGGSGRSPLWTR